MGRETKRTALGIHLADQEMPAHHPDTARQINNLKKAVKVAYQRIASQTKIIADMSKHIALSEQAMGNRIAAIEKRLAPPKSKRVVKSKPATVEEKE